MEKRTVAFDQQDSDHKHIQMNTLQVGLLKIYRDYIELRKDIMNMLSYHAYILLALDSTEIQHVYWQETRVNRNVNKHFNSILTNKCINCLNEVQHMNYK